MQGFKEEIDPLRMGSQIQPRLSTMSFSLQGRQTWSQGVYTSQVRVFQIIDLCLRFIILVFGKTHRLGCLSQARFPRS